MDNEEIKRPTTEECVSIIFEKYHSGKVKVEPGVALDLGFLCGAYMALLKPRK